MYIGLVTSLANRKLSDFQKVSCLFQKETRGDKLLYYTLFMVHQTNDLSTTYNVKKASFRTKIYAKKFERFTFDVSFKARHLV